MSETENSRQHTENWYVFENSPKYTSVIISYIILESNICKTKVRRKTLNIDIGEMDNNLEMQYALVGDGSQEFHQDFGGRQLNH